MNMHYIIPHSFPLIHWHLSQKATRELLDVENELLAANGISYNATPATLAPECRLHELPPIIAFK
jgi:hypothetical protein